MGPSAAKVLTFGPCLLGTAASLTAGRTDDEAYDRNPLRFDTPTQLTPRSSSRKGREKGTQLVYRLAEFPVAAHRRATGLTTQRTESLERPRLTARSPSGRAKPLHNPTGSVRAEQSCPDRARGCFRRPAADERPSPSSARRVQSV